MLLDLVREGEQIAAGCRASKFVKGVKARCVAWSRSVEEYLKDDPVALTRFRNAQPISGVHPDIAAAVANHWKKLQGQLAVLTDLAREREQEVVFALSPTLWGLGVNLKAACASSRSGSASAEVVSEWVGGPRFCSRGHRIAMSAIGTSATCNEPHSTSELESKPEISSWTDRASLIGTGLRRGCVVGYLMGEGWVHM